MQTHQRVFTREVSPFSRKVNSQRRLLISKKFHSVKQSWEMSGDTSILTLPTLLLAFSPNLILKRNDLEPGDGLLIHRESFVVLGKQKEKKCQMKKYCSLQP